MANPALVAYRTGFALVCFSALVTEVAVLVERGVFEPGNFFSYFTVLSNIGVVVALLAGALAAASGRASATVDLLRGAVTLYLIITGVVFSVLLAGIEGVEFTAVPWDNVVLHYLTPVVMVVDWLWDGPRRAIPFRRALLWLIFPVAYVPYSLVRGALVDWYPYPFLDPAVGGVGGVLVAVLGIAVLGLALTWLLVRWSREPKTFVRQLPSGP